MLKKLETIEQVSPLAKDDPVRPNLSADFRINNGREVYALYEDQYAEQAPVQFEGPRAVICVAYTKGVALTENDLDNFKDPDTAMFYTVWSYDRGAGRQIVNKVAAHIKETRDDIVRYMTLSPLTEMAERFHLRNGAKFFRKGTLCQNFEYERENIK